MDQVQTFFDVRNVYRNLGKPRAWIAGLISSAVLKISDTLIKHEYCRPDITVLTNPKKKKVTVLCKFSNTNRSYCFWFVIDPYKDAFELTKYLVEHWFKDQNKKPIYINKDNLKHQVEIDQLTRSLVQQFDSLMTNDNNTNPLVLITKDSEDVYEDTIMHTKYGTLWYVGVNKPLFGGSSYLSAGFAYLVK